MKKYVFLCCLIIPFFSLSTLAQEFDDLYASSNDNLKSQFKYGDLPPTSKGYYYKSYLSKGGVVYKIGDRLKIGVPISDKSFSSIIGENKSGNFYLAKSDSGKVTEINRIYVDGNLGKVTTVYFKTEGYNLNSKYVIDIEKAVAAKEITSIVMASTEAKSELKKCKENLNSRLITKQKYDSLKIILSVPLNIDYLKSADRLAKKGGILIITGLGTSLVGGILLFNYGIWTESAPNAKPYTHLTLWMPIGIVVMAGGLAIFGTGVGSAISGGVKKGRAKKLLQLNMVSFSPPNVTRPINEIGLKIRF